jgi:hypothetical protein
VKTVEIASGSLDIATLLEQAREEDLIVRLADGTEFLVVAVDDLDHELALTRGNEKLMAFLDARARQTQTVPLVDVKTQLGLVNGNEG